MSKRKEDGPHEQDRGEGYGGKEEWYVQDLNRTRGKKRGVRGEGRLTEGIVGAGIEGFHAYEDDLEEEAQTAMLGRLYDIQLNMGPGYDQDEILDNYESGKIPTTFDSLASFAAWIMGLEEIPEIKD